MAVVSKCISANPYKNNDAVVAISRRQNKAYTFPGPQGTYDPTRDNTKLSNRLNATNYYYGTSSTSTGTVSGGLRWAPY